MSDPVAAGLNETIDVPHEDSPDEEVAVMLQLPAGVAAAFESKSAMFVALPPPRKKAVPLPLSTP